MAPAVFSWFLHFFFLLIYMHMPKMSQSCTTVTHLGAF